MLGTFMSSYEVTSFNNNKKGEILHNLETILVSKLL